MKRSPLLALVLLLVGCSIFEPPQAHRRYVLEAAPVPSASASASASAVARRKEAPLLVFSSSVAAFYDTLQIAYSRTPGTRDYYQFSSLTETPAKALNAMLLSELERSGAFRSVASATSGISGNLLLTTKLEEIFHEASAPPGTARVTLSAQLSDPIGRKLIARRTFTASSDVSSFDAEGAVAGMRAALASAVAEEAAWVVQAAL